MENYLPSMFKELKNAPAIYQPSSFWKELNNKHLEQLDAAGFDNFKRSVNMRYFSWGILGIIRHQLDPVLSEIIRGNLSPFFASQLVDMGVRALAYRIYVAALFDYVSRIDCLGIFAKGGEPSLGNPIVIKYRGKLISQDLCNSVHEFYSSTEKLDLKDSKQITVAELGAGYGRLAYIFLKALPRASYCIVDIPPALYISQQYLSSIFPKKKIFHFRPFKKFSEVKEEFNSADIKFLMPHQMEYLPRNSFDLIISVSTLHEMSLAQIKNYIKQINRLCKGYFYTKQWRRSRVKDNSYIKENEYPIPENWHAIYERRHLIQRLFFEALYRIGASRT